MQTRYKFDSRNLDIFELDNRMHNMESHLLVSGMKFGWFLLTDFNI